VAQIHTGVQDRHLDSFSGVPPRFLFGDADESESPTVLDFEFVAGRLRLGWPPGFRQRFHCFDDKFVLRIDPLRSGQQSLDVLFVGSPQ
jgi:hypothetical protein